jgi:hypothetical protein
VGLMPNTIYDIARNWFALARIDWTVANLILLAYAGPPIFHPEDETVADIAAHGETTLIGTSQAMLTQTVSREGYLQTSNVVIPNVPIGDPLTHFVMTLSANTPLLFIDDATDLPFTPNGLDIVVTPDWLERRGWGRL